VHIDAYCIIVKMTVSAYRLINSSFLIMLQSQFQSSRLADTIAHASYAYDRVSITELSSLS